MAPARRPWPAPTAAGPVEAVVAVPGSKSLTNRALVLASLADGPAVVRRALRARDTKLMAKALRSLGAEIVDVSDDPGHRDWAVRPGPLHGPAHVDCGLAGTVMRFVPPVAALARGDVRFDGDPRARVRPMSAVVDALRSLGVEVADDGRGTLPFTVHGTGKVAGGEVVLDASSSSQFVSALLLVGARFRDGVTVRHRGDAVPSLPHIAMTVAMLRDHGVLVDADTTDPRSATWRVHPGPLAALDRTVEPDLSNAAPFLAAALVTGGRVTVPGWPESTTQAGDALREILTAMGGSVTLAGDGLTVAGNGRVTGVDLDLHDVGELTPVVAALCALADGPSRLRGIAHLRGHETDRLAALTHEINNLGGRVTERPDGLKIKPQPLRGGLFRTYDDHRMATAAAVLGLAVPGVQVEDIATTSKTLPGFDAMWAAMLEPRAAAAVLGA